MRELFRKTLIWQIRIEIDFVQKRAKPFYIVNRFPVARLETNMMCALPLQEPTV